MFHKKSINNINSTWNGLTRQPAKYIFDDNVPFVLILQVLGCHLSVFCLSKLTHYLINKADINPLSKLDISLYYYVFKNVTDNSQVKKPRNIDITKSRYSSVQDEVYI